MKPCIFFSDFDGTMSKKDFYLRYAEGHLSTLDAKLVAEYRAGTLTSYDYLNEMLRNIGASEEEIRSHIDDLEMEEYIAETVSLVKERGGDFTVISAGSTLYIRPVLDRVGLKEVPLFANEGEFIEGGMQMQFPKDDRFFCSFYGIKKAAVVESLKANYHKTIYAGDGSSDLEAAKLCDIRFAKRSLAKRLDKENVSYHPFESYHDIFLKLNEIFL